MKDFHSVIQPQPNVNNIEWSDEDCDYIFASSAVVSSETASSSRKVIHMNTADKICWFILFALITQFFPWLICLKTSFNAVSVLGCIAYSAITLSLIASMTIFGDK
jgi:hypothetical protein